MMKKRLMIMLAAAVLALTFTLYGLAETPAQGAEAGEAAAADERTLLYGKLLDDMQAAAENPSAEATARIDEDAKALGEEIAYAVAAHWKKVYLDPDYTLYMDGKDDPAVIPVSGKHAFVVLGYELENGEMTAELKGRCDAAAHAAAAFPESILVCSGGATGGNNPEKHTEAGLMKAYLTDVHGIAAERIFTDEKAMTTAENAINTFAILKEQQVDTMTIVTSSYHQRWGQVLYNALAAQYRAGEGYSAEIVGNYCYEIEPSSASFKRDYRIAVSQLRKILNLPGGGGKRPDGR